MKKAEEKDAAGAAKKIRELFAELSLEDKVKVIDSLVDPIKK